MLSNDGCDLCFLETKPYVTYPITCPEANSTDTSQWFSVTKFSTFFQTLPSCKMNWDFFFLIEEEQRNKFETSSCSDALLLV